MTTASDYAGEGRGGSLHVKENTEGEASSIVGKIEESKLFSDINEQLHSNSGLQTPLLVAATNVIDEMPEFDDTSGGGESAEVPLCEMLLSRLKCGTSILNSRSLDISISVIFLRDYENSRSCSLPSSMDRITQLQLFTNTLRHSFTWQTILHIAVGGLFLSSAFDDLSVNSANDDQHLQLILTLCAASVLAMDLAMRTIHDNKNYNRARKTRVQMWKIPTVIALVCICGETCIKNIADEKKMVWTAVLKPIVFFYASSKARDALTAIYHVGKIVFKVIVIELFLLLSFSSMASHLYFNFDSFRDLPSSFISLYEIQTTAATPSLWFPVYNENKSAALFFVSFLLICVFFIHSIVLSVVFQAYIHSMKMLRERASADREEALKLAFVALLSRDPDNDDFVEVGEQETVQVSKLREVVKILRPHYNASKIDALMQIIDPNCRGAISFSDYKIGIQKVLHTSLRRTRPESRQSLLLSSLTISVAIANLVYVLLLSSPLEFLLLSGLIFPAGCLIVILGLIEVTLRLRPCGFLSSLPMTRHSILDGLAIFASMISLIGLVMHSFNDNRGLQWLLLGRAIDMIRIMRLSSIFRSIIKRSGEVLPAIVGPLALVISSLHIFAYTGMAIWGGAVSVGSHNDVIVPLYDLNNFNNYAAGLLTMFNIFVVNDWQAIAQVYLNADRFFSPYIVYPFFICANLIGVNILLNVLTAFFVGAFVTKVEDKRSGERRDINLSMSTRLDAGPSNPLESITGFHVLERHGYDSVISTITGNEADVVKHYEILREQMEREKSEAIIETQNSMRSAADREITSVQRACMKMKQRLVESNNEKAILQQTCNELENQVEAMRATEIEKNTEISKLREDVEEARRKVRPIQGYGEKQTGPISCQLSS